MLGRTLRYPLLWACPVAPSLTGTLPPPLPRSVAAAGCNQFRALGPRSHGGEPGAALSPRRPSGERLLRGGYGRREGQRGRGRGRFLHR